VPVPVVLPSVTQLAELEAVQAQPVPAVTATVPVAPAAAIVADVLETSNVHGVAPLCVAVTDCPAMLAVAVRAVVVVCAAAVSVTLPFPVPLALPSVSQPAELVAVQAHPWPAVTLIVWVPPAGVKVAAVALSA
jgi:hypothetical protein